MDNAQFKVGFIKKSVLKKKDYEKLAENIGELINTVNICKLKIKNINFTFIINHSFQNKRV